MANKQKKKRNKVYQGAEAAITRPTVTKITAANRSKIGQWWFDHKRIARPILIAAAVVTVIVILIIELVRIANA
jgi:hypothetical protein